MAVAITWGGHFYIHFGCSIRQHFPLPSILCSNLDASGTIISIQSRLDYHVCLFFDSVYFCSKLVGWGTILCSRSPGDCIVLHYCITQCNQGLSNHDVCVEVNACQTGSCMPTLVVQTLPWNNSPSSISHQVFFFYKMDDWSTLYHGRSLIEHYTYTLHYNNIDPINVYLNI